MKNKLQPNQIKVLIAWMLLLIVGVAAFYFFYYTNQVDELDRAEQELAIEQQRQTTLERTINEQEEVEPTTMEQLIAQLPEGLGEQTFVEFVEQGADRRNITIESYAFDEPLNVPDEQVRGIIQQTVTINGLSTSGRDVEQFVQELESTDRIIHINRMTYQQQEEETTFQLQIIIYGAGKIETPPSE